MPAFGLKHYVHPIKIDALLGHADGGHRLERHPEHNGLTVADAALDTAAEIGSRAQASVFKQKGIVVLTAAHPGAGKTRADIKPLGGGQRKHGLGQSGLQFIKNRLAKAHRKIAADAGEDASGGILGRKNLTNQCLHALCRGSIGAADQLGIHIVSADVQDINLWRLNIADRAHPGDNLRAVGLAQPFFGNGPGRHPADGFPGAGPAAAAGRTDAVLALVGEIGMGGTGNPAHFAVITWPLILVVDQEHDRGSQGSAEFGARVNGHLIGLLTGSGKIALAGSPP